LTNQSAKEKELREKAIQAALDHYREYHSRTEYKPGDKIQYGGRVFDEQEMRYLIDSCLDFWLTAGRYADEFEKGLGKYLGIKFVSLVNSGSSANLLAFMALTSPILGKHRIRSGDEVITVAAAFPTTVAPIIQHGAIPIFVDVTLPQYNIDVDKLDAALSDHTKAVMLAHTLGNPFDLAKVKKFCDENDLWLIEDNCDSLGSQYKIGGEWKFTGTIGDLGTSSFYPPHHMTMGEGGAVYTDNPELAYIVKSLRDWGRDCHCPSGQDNVCGRRFSQQFGELPRGYDHKYVYSHFGYNLKAMQAAIGCAQLEKLPNFVEARKRNWKRMRAGLVDVADKLILPEPSKDSDPSWFGFMMTVRSGSGRTRQEIVEHLEKNKIQTRMMFAGNLIKHPCFDEMRNSKQGYRIVGDLKNTDLMMSNSFWIGVYPGLVEEQIDRQIECIHESLDSKVF
jgi:CDP-6-deoxy-D-xylo-4-hexulose-3-dehydrase